MTVVKEFKGFSTADRLGALRVAIQTSSDYPAPDIPAIPLERHFLEMPDQPALSG